MLRSIWPACGLLFLTLTQLTCYATVDYVDIKSAARKISPWLLSVRRELHQYPELQLNCHETSARIRAHLHDLGVTVRYPYAETGVVGVIGSGKPVVVLRADIDALPITEPAGLDFRSKHEGQMHACGHDVHTTMLLGAANLLKQYESQLSGTVLLVFQPDEEGGTGARLIIQQGAVDGAAAAFGMHVMPTIPVGQLALRSGTIMAAQQNFLITVSGRGGHAAMPHLNIDPVPAAAAVIQALQTLVSRETSPLGSAVVSVTHLQGSNADNITPDNVTLRGTLRALSTSDMEHLKQRVQELLPGVAAAYRCNATVAWDAVPYPSTVNDPEAAEFAMSVAAQVLGDDNVLDTEPLMIAEDFAYFGQAVPSAFMFVGIRNESLGAVHNLHSVNFKVDEEVLHLGAAIHAGLAIEFLGRQQAESGKKSLSLADRSTAVRNEL